MYNKYYYNIQFCLENEIKGLNRQNLGLIYDIRYSVDILNRIEKKLDDHILNCSTHNLNGIGSSLINSTTIINELISNEEQLIEIEQKLTDTTRFPEYRSQLVSLYFISEYLLFIAI